MQGKHVGRIQTNREIYRHCGCTSKPQAEVTTRNRLALEMPSCQPLPFFHRPKWYQTLPTMQPLLCKIRPRLQFSWSRLNTNAGSKSRIWLLKSWFYNHIKGSVCQGWAVDWAPTDKSAHLCRSNSYPLRSRHVTWIKTKRKGVKSGCRDAGTGDLGVLPTQETSPCLDDAGSTQSRWIPLLVKASTK